MYYIYYLFNPRVITLTRVLHRYLCDSVGQSYETGVDKTRLICWNDQIKTLANDKTS